MKILYRFRAPLAEAGAAALIISGADTIWGRGGALIVGGICLFLKAFEWDLDTMPDGEETE